MYSSKKGFDPIEFVFGKDIGESAWNTEDLLDYIKDIISESLNSYRKASEPEVTTSIRDSFCEAIKEFSENLSGNINAQEKKTKAVFIPAEEETDFTSAELSETDHAAIQLSPAESTDGKQVSCIEQEEGTSPMQQNESLESNVYENIYEKNQQTNRSQQMAVNMGIQPDIMETCNMFVIKLRIPEGINEDDLRISIKDTHVTIKWSSSYMEQFIPLPSDIIFAEACAAIKDGNLEIKVPRKHNGNQREINIIKY